MDCPEAQLDRVLKLIFSRKTAEKAAREAAQTPCPGAALQKEGAGLLQRALNTGASTGAEAPPSGELCTENELIQQVQATLKKPVLPERMERVLPVFTMANQARRNVHGEAFMRCGFGNYVTDTHPRRFCEGQAVMLASLGWMGAAVLGNTPPTHTHTHIPFTNHSHPNRRHPLGLLRGLDRGRR